LSRIGKLSAANLSRNWVMIPAVTYHEEADVTDLEAFRQQINAEQAKAGVKLTMLAFIIKAVCSALKKFPAFNSSIDLQADEPALIMKQYCHIGFAADTPGGLVVPVIRDADRKGVAQLAAECGELAARARDGKLSAAEMQGACFTDFQRRRPRRHRVRAHHQRARSGHPRREPHDDEAGVGRLGLPAAADPATVADRGSPRGRRRRCHPLQRTRRRAAGRHAPRADVRRPT
jgi:hypothetical protein